MIETNKIILKGNKFGGDAQREEYLECEKHAKELLSFGWEQIDDEAYKKIGKAWYHYVTLARVKEMPMHDELVSLEKEYEDARKSVKPVPKINGFVAFLLLLLIIFPGVIYLNVKNKKKKKTIAANKEAELKSFECMEKAKGILNS